jgi:acetyltransferase-like isoleucine patch superfamily enzyme
MFGPQVVLIGGGHNTSVVGRFMVDVHEKRPEDDRGVVIEDDVWVGCRAMILRGARIGRGSIVAAGAVVTKPVPPYSVVGGLPARVLKRRWDVETILRHEAELYPEGERLARADLERWEAESPQGSQA